MKRFVLAIAGALVVVAVGAAFVGHARAEEESVEREAMAALDAFMTAFNARDAEAWAETLHYPHVRVAGGDVRVWETADEYAAYMDFDRFIQQTGWDHSEWGERVVVQSGKGKVHIAVQFSRYDKDGNKIATYDSLYVVTERDGHWGTQARSSFAP